MPLHTRARITLASVLIWTRALDNGNDAYSVFDSRGLAMVKKAVLSICEQSGSSYSQQAMYLTRHAPKNCCLFPALGVWSANIVSPWLHCVCVFCFFSRFSPWFVLLIIWPMFTAVQTGLGWKKALSGLQKIWRRRKSMFAKGFFGWWGIVKSD